MLTLAREFASDLATPIYIADAEENLVYFNEAAERIAGRSFAETGRIPITEWVEMLEPSSPEGDRLQRDEMPGGIALRDRRPTHASLRITDLLGTVREIATTAYPLTDPSGEFHGIMVIFWEDA